MLRLRARIRASRLVALFAALVVAALLVACGTILDIAPDAPLGGEGGDGGNTTSDGPDATLDGSSIFLPDGAIACPISADRVTLSMGEVLTGMSHRETIRLSTASTDTRSVTITVTGDTGFRTPTTTLTVSPAGATFDVFFDAGSGGANMATTGQLAISYAGCSVPIAIDLLATRSTAQYAVTPGVVDLGVTACGTAPSPAVLSIVASDAGSTAQWTISAGTPFVAPPSGSLASGTADISINATTLPMTPPQRFDASLALTIDGISRTVPATVLSKGGVITFDKTEVVIIKPATSGSVQVTNAGNLTMIFEFIVNLPFTVTPIKLTLAPGATGQLTFSIPTNGSFASSSLVTVISAGAGKVCSFGALTVSTSTL